ncbi:hypothetical protein, partial [Micromonospora sp. DT233]|uniref:hypothetical protein n=1 Tax=Micromonospora sp. DT233 TaxID=3393432 RepID=UPI003CF95335
MAVQQVTKPDGSTVYYDDESGNAIRQVSPDGVETTFTYRGDQYVATTDGNHVLVGADGREIYAWVGNDESVRSVYSWGADGSFSVKGPDGSVREFTAGRDPVRE